jgi:hypothetical protein
LGAAKGHTALVELLISEAGSGIVDVQNTFGITAMHSAASAGHADVITVLVEAGANLETKRRDGVTPLVAAAIAGSLPATTLLLSLGGDNSKCLETLRVLEVASSDEVKCLLETTAAVQAMAGRGQVDDIRSEVITESLQNSWSVPMIQWGPLLSTECALELQKWAACTMGDAEGCFVALFGRSELEGAQLPFERRACLRGVVHDGQEHLRDLIISFLVFPRAGTRGSLRGLTRLGKASK